MNFAIDQQLTVDAWTFQKGQSVKLSPSIDHNGLAMMAYRSIGGVNTVYHLASGQETIISFAGGNGWLGIFGVLKPVPHYVSGPSVSVDFGPNAGKDFSGKEAALLTLTGESVAAATTYNGTRFDGMDYFDSNVVPEGFILDVNALLKQHNLDHKSVKIECHQGNSLMIESGVMIQANTRRQGQPNTYLAEIFDDKHKVTNMYIDTSTEQGYLTAFIKPTWTPLSSGKADLIFQVGDPQKDGTVKLQTV